MINEGDMSLLIDKNRIRREKHKIRYSLQSDSPNVELHGLYFDGRKGNICYQEKNGNKMYHRLKKEEHINLVQEPDGKFLGHLIPPRATESEILG